MRTNVLWFRSADARLREQPSRGVLEEAGCGVEKEFPTGCGTLFGGSVQIGICLCIRSNSLSDFLSNQVSV